MNLDELGYVATEDGRFVSSDHMRIAEILSDYDPELQLGWIPPEERNGNRESHPWAVFYRGKLIATYEECDQRILEHIWGIDTQRHDVLSQLDKENAAAKAIALKKELELSEMRQDYMASALKTPLHKYTLPSGTVVRG